MNVILNFFVNNYLWFLIICLILIFALIGYFVDIKKDERFETKIELDKELESKLAVAEAANLTLNQMMKSPQIAAQNAESAAPVEAAATEAPAEVSETKK